jgi:flagellar biogenesis protein FliO
MREELKKKAEELEQTLEMQMSLAKKESEDLVKVGGAILVGGVIAFLAVRLFIGKKDKKTEKILKVLEKEGLLDEEIQSKLTKKNQPGFLGRLSAVLVPIAINYGREQLIKKFKEEGPLGVKDEE